jgi:hypothetical protein
MFQQRNIFEGINNYHRAVLGQSSVMRTLSPRSRPTPAGKERANATTLTVAVLNNFVLRCSSMVRTNCLIVRAYGSQLDQLRGEADKGPPA